MNADNSQFTLTLAMFLDELSLNSISAYSQIAMSVILVGSDFSGYSDTIESSYIYPRNDDLEIVTYDDTTIANNVGQFNFEILDSPSPFNYIVSGSLGQGCGVIRKNSQLIVETL